MREVGVLLDLNVWTCFGNSFSFIFGIIHLLWTLEGVSQPGSPLFRGYVLVYFATLFCLV